VIRYQPIMRGKRLTDGIQRAGADIAKYHADGTDDKAGEADVAVGVAG